MHQKYKDTLDDDIVLNLNGFYKKVKVVLKKKLGILLLLFVVTASACFAINQYVVKDKYKGSITYLVTCTGDSSSDAYVATMLGSQMSKLYESSGLEDLIQMELGEDASWMRKRYLSGEFDSSTNMFTMEVETPSKEHTKTLLEAIKTVLPIYASKQFGYVLLHDIDEFIDLDTPSNAKSLIKNIGIGIVAGIVIAALSLMISVVRNKMVYSKEDMKSFTSLSCIAQLEKIKRMSKKEKCTILKPNKRNRMYISSIHKLRIKVESLMKKEKVLMVTSTVSQEGKTTISTNLALSLAKTEKKVLLIDTDVYKAGVKDVLPTEEVSNYLGDYLQEKAEIKDVVYTTEMIDVIYGDDKNPIEAILLDSQRMKDLFSWARKEYDYIIVDTAPSLWRSDASLLSKQVDALLYVVQYAHATKEEIARGIQSISGESIHMLGYVLNGTDESDLKYSDYYK